MHGDAYFPFPLTYYILPIQIRVPPHLTPHLLLFAHKEPNPFVSKPPLNLPAVQAFLHHCFSKTHSS